MSMVRIISWCMKAKNFRFGPASPKAMPAARGISLPTKRLGEDTPGVSPRELHRIKRI